MNDETGGNSPVSLEKFWCSYSHGNRINLAVGSEDFSERFRSVGVPEDTRTTTDVRTERESRKR